MMYAKIGRGAFVALALSVLCACSQGPTAAQQAAAHKAAMEAQAQQELVTYRKMIALKSYDLALPLAQEIETRYPGTKAAAEVKAELADVRAKAQAQANKLRLKRLWVYQVAPMAGGTQSTAAIDASSSPGLSVRLILRRHSIWGLSVFLYADGSQGFDCARTCIVPVQFDKKTFRFRAYVPKGGRPALMFRKEKAFIALLEKSSVIHMKVRMNALGERDLKFEVGGFDPSSWKPLKKK